MMMFVAYSNHPFAPSYELSISTHLPSYSPPICQYLTPNLLLVSTQLGTTYLYFSHLIVTVNLFEMSEYNFEFWLLMMDVSYPID